MTTRFFRWMAFFVIVICSLSILPASETSVLVGILVRKGILTEEEARAVIDEASLAVLESTPEGAVPPVAADSPVSDLEPEKESMLVLPDSKIATNFEIGGRLQVQYADIGTDIEGSEEDPGRTRHFFLRRVYLTTKGRFGPQWDAKVTYDFANSGFDAAFVRYKVNDDNHFVFGLKKVNLAYEEVLSSGRQKAIERSGVTRYFAEANNGRRLGAASYRVGVFYDGTSNGFFYGGAITNPERPVIAVDAASDGDVWNNGLAYWANGGFRAEYEGGSAIFGAAVGYLQDQGDLIGTGENMTVGSVFADATLGEWRLMTELLLSDTGTARPWGFYLQPSVMFTPRVEGVFRLSFTDSDGRGIRTSDGIRSAPSAETMDKLVEGYLGANWYIMGNDMKLQGGVVFGRTEDTVGGGDARADVLGFRSQLQLNF